MKRKYLIVFILILLCSFIHAQEKERRKKEKQHGQWDKAFTVLLKGDTIFGRIKPNALAANEWRYTPVSYLSRNPFSKPEEKIVFAFSDDKEDTIDLNEVVEIGVNLLLDSVSRYLLLEFEGNREVFHVIEPGFGSVVAKEEERAILENVDIRKLSNYNRWPSAGAGKGSMPATYIFDDYYFYYKSKLFGIELNAFAKKKKDPAILTLYVKMFADCPLLVEKIKDKNFVEKDFFKIVKEFNQCVTK